MARQDPRCRGSEEGKDAKRMYSIEAGLAMLQECLISDCQRKFSIENFKVVKRNATQTPLKPRLRTSIFQLSPGNRLYRIEKSGVASPTKEPHSLMQRESVKLKESAKNGKQELRDHHQTRHSPISHTLFATKIGFNSHQLTCNPT